jgi:hypothetical protein
MFIRTARLPAPVPILVTLSAAAGLAAQQPKPADKKAVATQNDQNAATDAATAAVRVFPNLYPLTLERTGVTDAGLTALAAAPKRRRLTATGSKVTPEGVAKFRADHPAVAITP